MSEFGQQWRLVSKEKYDEFQRHRAMEVEQNSEKLRELLEEAFSAGWTEGSENYGYYDTAYDFDGWFEKRFS